MHSCAIARTIQLLLDEVTAADCESQSSGRKDGVNVATHGEILVDEANIESLDLDERSIGPTGLDER
jgi:hypothetical protein